MTSLAEVGTIALGLAPALWWCCISVFLVIYAGVFHPSLPPLSGQRECVETQLWPQGHPRPGRVQCCPLFPNLGCAAV